MLSGSVSALLILSAYYRGVINTWGIYQTYYSLEILKTSSSSTIAWIGSVQAFLLLFVGALTGPLYVRKLGICFKHPKC